MLDGSPENRVTELNDSIDTAQANSFLHLWDWDMQVRLCERIVKLLRDKPWSMVLGRQVGDGSARVSHCSGSREGMWRHDVKTFRRMWEVVGNKRRRRMRMGWTVDGEV